MEIKLITWMVNATELKGSVVDAAEEAERTALREMRSECGAYATLRVYRLPDPTGGARGYIKFIPHAP